MAATTTTTTTMAAPPAAGEAAKLKNDKGKLTELHGEPPVVIKRNENGFLNRGRMLGEGGFARVYAATDSISGSTKAVKVISKEQLKSSKTKAKVGRKDVLETLHLLFYYTHVTCRDASL